MSESALFEVAMGEGIKSVRYPHALLTGALETCSGIGILNVGNRVGRLGHFEPHHQQGPKRIIQMSTRRGVNPNDLFAATAGNIPSSRELFDDVVDFEAEIERYRTYAAWVLELLISHGIPPENIQHHMVNEPGHKSYAIMVDTFRERISVGVEKVTKHSYKVRWLKE